MKRAFGVINRHGGDTACFGGQVWITGVELCRGLITTMLWFWFSFILQGGVSLPCFVLEVRKDKCISDVCCWCPFKVGGDQQPSCWLMERRL